MAITQVRAQFNGQWYTLTYNEDARAYQTAITPDTFSGGQPDGYYDVTVEATNDSGVVVTTDGGNLPGLRLVVRETIPPILTLVSPEAGYVTTNTPAVTWTAQDNAGGSGIDPDSAMVKLAEELKNVSFGTPSMPVYCNYEARVVEGPDDIRNVLEHQVCGSVRWTASMQKLVDQGHRLFIELGPGKTLAGMMGRICKDATVISIEDVPSLEAAVAELNK